MTLIESAILGIVQGLTEFLPVSSDGHLAVTYRLFGQMPNLPFEVLLHMATLLALVVYFRSDIVALAKSLGTAGKGSAERQLLWLIAGATVVSAGLAFALKKLVESANESLIAIGLGFAFTAVVLVVAELFGRRMTERQPSALGWKRTGSIAIAQALATLPGVSRSGSTISAGMLSGLDREAAARFSFLLGIPIIAAANVFEAKDMLSAAGGMPSAPVILVGFATAAVAGYLAIAGLLAVVRKHTLYAFSVYTGLVAVAVITWGVLAR